MLVYQIPYSCGKYYMGETMRRLGTRLKEHKDACERCLTDKSAIAEHVWNQHHPITWDGTEIIDKARREDELGLKEAFHIQMSNNDFNRDVGEELPRCWTSLARTLNRPHRVRGLSQIIFPTVSVLMTLRGGGV